MEQTQKTQSEEQRMVLRVLDKIDQKYKKELNLAVERRLIVDEITMAINNAFANATKPAEDNNEQVPF